MQYTIEVSPTQFLFTQIEKLPEDATSVVFKATWTNERKYSLQDKSAAEVHEAFKNLPKTVRKIDCRNNGLGHFHPFHLKLFFLH
ncbi:hypothetical protein [Legionella cardiaca]|uniref:Uncharacterized protein n=1 Tax=Legionella cardiaca TaxID=1071983 RepID=A0ABY8AQG6_9GAMM|nr:hypothetical protein [Legionella cardiaca]WED42935.1 hypothetical protein PXX05_13685 [Legionella cardiaca]